MSWRLLRNKRNKFNDAGSHIHTKCLKQSRLQAKSEPQSEMFMNWWVWKSRDIRRKSFMIMSVIFLSLITYRNRKFASSGNNLEYEIQALRVIKGQTHLTFLLAENSECQIWPAIQTRHSKHKWKHTHTHTFECNIIWDIRERNISQTKPLITLKLIRMWLT